jgi:hypothetical protein
LASTFSTVYVKAIFEQLATTILDSTVMGLTVWSVGQPVCIVVAFDWLLAQRATKAMTLTRVLLRSGMPRICVDSLILVVHIVVIGIVLMTASEFADVVQYFRNIVTGHLTQTP